MSNDCVRQVWFVCRAVHVVNAARRDRHTHPCLPNLCNRPGRRESQLACDACPPMCVNANYRHYLSDFGKISNVYPRLPNLCNRQGRRESNLPVCLCVFYANYLLHYLRDFSKILNVNRIFHIIPFFVYSSH